MIAVPQRRVCNALLGNEQKTARPNEPSRSTRRGERVPLPIGRHWLGARERGALGGSNGTRVRSWEHNRRRARLPGGTNVMEAAMADQKSVLVIGLDPALIDFSKPGYAPGMDATKVLAGLKSSEDELT